MALSPEYTQNQSDRVVKLYGNILEDFTANISSKLETSDKLLKAIEKDVNVVNEWRTSRIAQLPKLRGENIKAIQKESKNILSESTDAIAESGYYDVTHNEHRYLEAKTKGFPMGDAVPLDESIRLKQVLLTFQNNAVNDLNLVNSTMLENSLQKYRDIVDYSTAKVLTGQTTLDKAVRSSVRKMAQDGFTGFVRRSYVRKDGTVVKEATIESEAAVNMIMRSTTNNVAIAMQDERSKEWGTSFFEISSHLDARTLCASDQGKIVDKSLTYRDETFKGVYISDWSKTSYGEAAGIFGINCRHNEYPFFPSISERSEPIDTKENKEDYAQSQEQRRLERKIRSAKREKIAAQNRPSNDSKKEDKQEVERATKKVSAAQKEMRNFTDKTGRTRRYNREQVVYSGSTTTTKKSKIKKPTFTPVKTKQEAIEYAKNKFNITADYAKFKDIKVINTINEELTRAADIFGDKSVIDSIDTLGGNIKKTKAMGTYWQNKKHIGYITSYDDVKWAEKVSKGFDSTGEWQHVIRHEIGHAVASNLLGYDIDTGKYNNKETISAIMPIYQEIKKAGRSREFRYTWRQHFKDKISEYGMTNFDEFMAEVIAEYMAGNPRETAKSVVEILLR